MRAPLAVVTMVYNEPVFLPVWLRHYARIVGMERCYVIDHGTDDGSTDALPCNRLRIPRSPQDDAQRTRAISAFCAGLLEWYETVLYCDVDEILVADPACFPSLPALCASRSAPYLTAIGFDLIHHAEQEPDLDFNRPLSLQRKSLRFSAAMCKPCLIRTPATWSPGFHSVKESLPSPDPALMLFHLRYSDLKEGLRRLARTRKQAWCSRQAGAHQRMSNRAWREMLAGMAGLTPEETTLLGDDPTLTHWRERLVREGVERAGDPYPIDLSLSGDRLWPLPKRFRGLF
ncbi:glycosyltransferase family 2 protein [Asaia sp. HN010]|uniref:glycosyltransferase family 2 protein n=1 Tax=Asaia sp. HN010 TaxID=3081233 RepID=UPI003019AA35